MVAISRWKCWVKGSRKASIIARSWVPEKSKGSGRVDRYSSKDARPARKDSDHVDSHRLETGVAWTGLWL
jgi:hypothetical protein